MAHTKAIGSTQLGRDSQPKYLGVKLYTGEPAKPGSIIIRQRGTSFRPGKNVKKGSDDTLFAMRNGIVRFLTRKIKKYDGRIKTGKIDFESKI